MAGGCSTTDKNEKIYDAALSVACGGLYTVRYTVRTVYGDFGCYFTKFYERKRTVKTKRISRYSTC